MNQPDNLSIPVVAFDSTYKLVAIFKSIKEASAITGIVRQSIIKAVYGDIISVKKHYFRAVPQDLIIDTDDMNKLSLFEFDQEIGTNRKIYGSRKMGRSDIILESEYIKKNKKCQSK